MCNVVVGDNYNDTGNGEGYPCSRVQGCHVSVQVYSKDHSCNAMCALIVLDE